MESSSHASGPRGDDGADHADPANTPPPGDVDAAADLALLHRSQSNLAIDQALDAGPWWYAPLAALAVTAGALAAHTGSRAVLGIVIVSCILLAVHDRIRRPVRPRPSSTNFAIAVPTVVGVFVLMGLWSAAISAVGYDDFMPWWALAGWALTTALFVMGRWAMGEARRRRSALE